jgi:hypothetical protein
MEEVSCESRLVAATFSMDLLDDKLGVPPHEELTDPRDRAAVRPKISASYSTILLVALNSSRTTYCSWVFAWVGEDYSRASTLLAGRPIEEKRPVGLGEDRAPTFRWYGTRCGVQPPEGTRGWSPFHDEVGQDLTFDGVAGLEVQLELGEFCCPLGDVASGIWVVEDGP